MLNRRSSRTCLLKALLPVFMLLASATLSAQSYSDYIDVVYLKDGSKIKGIIVEQIPGKSLKIETSLGNQLSFPISQVEKLTRELKDPNTKQIAQLDGPSAPKKQEPKPFFSRPKGYFGNIELLMSGSPGLRVINGYKFGRLGYLGLAIGIEANNMRAFDQLSNPFMGSIVDQKPFLTFNAVYAGDILKRKITPFYQVELGYGMNLNGNEYVNYDGGLPFYYNLKKSLGGPMGGAVFGVKFNTRKRVNFKLGLNARWFSEISRLSSDLPTFVLLPPKRTFDLAGAMGIRFAIGF